MDGSCRAAALHPLSVSAPCRGASCETDSVLKTESVSAGNGNHGGEPPARPYMTMQ